MVMEGVIVLDGISGEVLLSVCRGTLSPSQARRIATAHASDILARSSLCPAPGSTRYERIFSARCNTSRPMGTEAGVIRLVTERAAATAVEAAPSGSFFADAFEEECRGPRSLSCARPHGSAIFLLGISRLKPGLCEGGLGLDVPRFLRLAWRRVLTACAVTQDELLASAASVSAWALARTHALRSALTGAVVGGATPSAAIRIVASEVRAAEGGYDEGRSEGKKRSSWQPRPADALSAPMIQQRVPLVYLSLYTLLLRCGDRHMAYAATHDGLVRKKIH